MSQRMAQQETQSHCRNCDSYVHAKGSGPCRPRHSFFSIFAGGIWTRLFSAPKRCGKCGERLPQ
jgi:hypothetical protein